MTAVIRALSEWAAGGSALAALVKVVRAICTGILGLLYRRYLGILGADRRKPAERQAYDALRKSLAEGNIAARLYADRLTRFLDWIDRFFGDAGMADRTLFPHAFGLTTAVPLWTAPAFDRCLLLSLAYPVVTTFAIWAVSGDAGPAQVALGLKPDSSGLERAVAVVAIAALAFLLRFAFFSRYVYRSDNMLAVSLALTVSVIALAGASHFVGSVVPAAVVLAVAVRLILNFTHLDFAREFVFIGAATVTVAIALVIASAVVLEFASNSTVANLMLCGCLLFIGVVACAIVWAREVDVIRRWQLVFLSALLVVATIACLMAADFLPQTKHWRFYGSLLLFLGLLALLNTPFDWASLGLTRALLRRGLELGGWWPYALALVDAGLAAVIIAALALTMVVGGPGF